MGHVVAVPEQAIVVCNGCMILNMKPLDVGYMLKPKKPLWLSQELLEHGPF